jgi:hypothetical protein
MEKKHAELLPESVPKCVIIVFTAVFSPILCRVGAETAAVLQLLW